jgi:hypothetical protein
MFLSLYYRLKPFIPRWLQIAVRGVLVRRKRRRVGDIWPIDPRSATPPPGWAGWPDGKKFAFVLTHEALLQDSLVRFFRPEDEEGLARAMVEMVYDEELRRRLVTNASVFVAQNSWEVKKGEYLALVDSLVQGARHRAQGVGFRRGHPLRYWFVEFLGFLEFVV